MADKQDHPPSVPPRLPPWARRATDDDSDEWMDLSELLKKPTKKRPVKPRDYFGKQLGSVISMRVMHKHRRALDKY